MISHSDHTKRGISMDIHEGKYAWMVKIGEKGQFVIPKETSESLIKESNSLIIICSLV